MKEAAAGSQCTCRMKCPPSSCASKVRDARQDHEPEDWRAGYVVWRQPAGKNVIPGLNPLIAPSHEVPVAEASHEGAAETAAHHADEEDENSNGRSEGSSSTTSESADSSRVGGTSGGRTPYRAWCAASARGRRRNAEHKRLAAAQDHVIETVSVGRAFFGEPDQSAKACGDLARTQVQMD